MRSKPHGLAALVLLVTFSSGACTAEPPTDLDRLRALPEASLLPAGSEQLASGGGNTDRFFAGTVPATTWAIHGTDAPAEDVLEFYTAELAERGWTEGGGVSGIRGTHELDVAAWHKNEVIFRLGFWELDEWRQSQDVGLEYGTIFEPRLVQEVGDEES